MKKCPKCDFSYPDEKNFCKNCGSKLTSTVSSEDIAQKSVYEDKIMLNPLNTEILKEYAQFLYNKLLHNDVIDILNKILVIDKNDSFAKELLYKSYEKVGNLEDAAKIAEKLLDSNPLDLILLKDLSEIAFKSEKEKEALIYLNRIIEIKPNDKYALIKKSEILLKLNNEKETLEALKKVLEIAPDNIMAQFEVGINSCMENDYRKACELLGAVLIKLKNDDDKNKALFFYSYALFKLSPNDKRLASRIQEINIALLVNNLNNQERILLEELLIFQGNLNIEQKNFDNAINSYNEAYLLNKSNISKQILADKLFEFAKDKFNAKEITCSKENIEKALYLYPDNKEYKVLLDNIRKVIIKKRKKIIIWSIVSFFVMIIILCSILIPPFLTEKRAWEKAKSENTSHAYQAFIDEYSSNCWYADEAYKKIKQKDSIKEAKNAAEDSSFAIIENSKITTMLKEYYSIIQSKEYDKLKEYFSNPVERYYDSYNISPDKVVENFFIYLKKYPFQQLTVDYNSLSISKKPASYTLIYNAVFLLKKKETDNFQQYDITMDVTLNTDFKITSIYEKKNSKKNIGASSENPEVTSSNKAMQLTINGSKVNIRALPNLKASVMFQLNTGDVCVIIENGNWVNINGNIDRWYKINYNGKIGWVYGSFVNIENNNIKVKQKIPQGRS